MAEQMSTRALLGLEKQTYLMGQKFTGSVTYYGALEPSPYDTNGHGAPIKCSSCAPLLTQISPLPRIIPSPVAYPSSLLEVCVTQCYLWARAMRRELSRHPIAKDCRNLVSDEHHEPVRLQSGGSKCCACCVGAGSQTGG